MRLHLALPIRVGIGRGLVQLMVWSITHMLSKLFVLASEFVDGSMSVKVVYSALCGA
jgi:hypothetical protein